MKCVNDAVSKMLPVHYDGKGCCTVRAPGRARPTGTPPLALTLKQNNIRDGSAHVLNNQDKTPKRRWGKTKMKARKNLPVLLPAKKRLLFLEWSHGCAICDNQPSGATCDAAAFLSLARGARSAGAGSEEPPPPPRPAMSVASRRAPSCHDAGSD